MKQATLAFVFNEWWEIMLCMKKRWFWVWKWNWAWWKKDLNETIHETAKRELLEETWVNLELDLLEFRWVLHFIWEATPDWNQDVHVFRSLGYSWEFSETEEMKPAWFKIDEIPYDDMWEDDAIWLPVLIRWEEFEYTVIFWADWNLKEYKRDK